MIPYFQNASPFDLALPTYNGSTVVVPPGKLVKGSYYQELADLGIVVLFTGTVIPTDVMYTYPEPSGSTFIGGPGTITAVIAGAGLEGGGSSGSVTLDVSGVTSMMLAPNLPGSILGSGQVVKSLNSLHDAVVLAAGANLTITPSGNTLTFDAPTIGFTALNATVPLILTTPDAGVTINGSIAITPANNGGAVALQSASPVFQTGFAAIDALFLPANGEVTIGGMPNTGAYFFVTNDVADPNDYVVFNDNSNSLVFGVTKLGVTNIADVAVTVGTVSTTLTFGSNAIILDPLTTTKFSVPVSMDGVWTLTGAGQFVANNGGVSPFSLSTSSAVTPLIKVASTVAGGDILSVKNNALTPVVTASLNSDGDFYAASVKADNLITTSEQQLAGAVVLDFTSSYAYACDASLGTITFTLPTLTNSSPSGLQFLFKKIDVSTNGVMVAAAAGQALDGAMSQTISTQWAILKVMSVVSGASAYWITV